MLQDQLQLAQIQQEKYASFKVKFESLEKELAIKQRTEVENTNQIEGLKKLLGATQQKLKDKLLEIEEINKAKQSLNQKHQDAEKKR